MNNSIVNILMVDDRHENLLALEAVLTSPRYRLITAKSGEEALRWVLKEEFAVILMDVQMPGLNGFDTAKIIQEREKTKDVPIIFITALSQTTENVLHGYSIGAIDYIIKPFDPIILKCKVEAFVSIYLNRKKVMEQKEEITKRTKELEDAYYKLKKSEAVSRAFGEASIDCFFTLDKEATILSVNPAVSGMFGYDEEEIIGKKIDLLLPELFNESIENVPKKKIVETIGYKKNQTKFPVDMQIADTVIDLDTIFVCSIRDITEKKNQYEILESLVKDRTNELISINEKLQIEIEEKQVALGKLEEKKQRFQSLFEYNPDAIFSCDLDGNIISYNKGFLNLTGRTAEELPQDPKNMLVQKEDYTKVVNHFEESKKGNPQDYELKVIHKDGHLIDVQVKNIPIIINEKVIGVYGIAKDVSVERKLWKQLFESEEKYRHLVEESPEAIVVRRTTSDRLTFINKTGIELLQAKSKSEIIGKSLFEFVHPEDHDIARRVMEALNNGEEVGTFEEKLITMEGEVLDVEVTIIPFFYENEPSLHIMIRDVTELKKSREFIQQTEKLTVVGELAAGIAHEIRNPLTSLKGFTQLLEFQIGNDNDYVDIMISEIDRINTIVSELLLLAKPNKVDFKSVNLLELLENIIILMNAQANLHGVEIMLLNNSLKNNLFVFGLENKIKQVLINVLKNGIEAMPNGGEITIEVTIEGDQIILDLIDQGCGIPKDVLPKLGQPFYTTKEKGTGLGLMVCQSIIESHQGSFKIDSIENVGTTVSIRLPQLINQLQLV